MKTGSMEMNVKEDMTVKKLLEWVRKTAEEALYSEVDEKENAVEALQDIVDAIDTFLKKRKSIRIKAKALDPDSRTAIEKQELKLMAQNERYAELVNELTLLKSLIKSCEFALEIFKLLAEVKKEGINK